MKKIVLLLFTIAFVLTTLGALFKLESWAYSSYFLTAGIIFWCAAVISIALWLAKGSKT